jgi:xanthine dehydrogenase accessory factor
MILVRGGGDLASGVIYRLYQAGMQVVVTELPQPLVVRRLVSFAEAIYQKEHSVEGVPSRLANDCEEALALLKKRIIPVLIDPAARCREALRTIVLVDGRMTKQPPELGIEAAPLVIGLGPGFIAGENCHAVIETNRGHTLGRVIWQGRAEADTGLPEAVFRRQADRVLRAPRAGKLQAFAEIGERLKTGQKIAEIEGEPILAPFEGVLRGIIHPGSFVGEGTKVGDLDPRNDPRFCRLISEKSLAVGGGVLEAILTRPEIRRQLWN